MPIERSADNVLVIRPAGGLLAPSGRAMPGEESTQAALDVRYFYQLIDGLYRDATRFRAGDRVALSGLVVEVTEVTDDGRPSEVAYRFDTTLDGPSRRWLQWSGGVYVPFPVPGVGNAVVLPPATVPASSWGR